MIGIDSSQDIVRLTDTPVTFTLLALVLANRTTWVSGHRKSKSSNALQALLTAYSPTMGKACTFSCLFNYLNFRCIDSS